MELPTGAMNLIMLHLRWGRAGSGRVKTAVERIQRVDHVVPLRVTDLGLADERWWPLRVVAPVGLHADVESDRCERERAGAVQLDQHVHRADPVVADRKSTRLNSSH